MKCANPTLSRINQITGKRDFIEFRLASPLKKQLYTTPLNCGKCLFCRKKNAFSLAVRCVLHASLYEQNCFLTLTYDENKPNYHNKLSYKDIQDFKKRLRSYIDRKFQRKVEIFNVHEYGKNGKKHWHLVLFNFDFPDKTEFFMKNTHMIYTSEELNKIWGHGHCSIGSVTEASAMYQAQYTQKDIKNGNENSEKKAKSNHKGIGFPYFKKHYRQILLLGYVPFGDQKIPIPRSFERIAHKHYSHFYEPINFFKTTERERLYTPFKAGEENREIADLYIYYRDTIKAEKILELSEKWEQVISKHLQTGEKPDFIKSAENALYDYKNKNSVEKF